MEDHCASSSDDSDMDDLDADFSKSQRSTISNESKKLLHFKVEPPVEEMRAIIKTSNLSHQREVFNALKEKSSHIREMSAKRQQKTEERRSRKLVKKALKDPAVRQLVESESLTSKESASNTVNESAEQWAEVKSFLTVNDHLQGPVSHGDCGPKTELEYIIEDAIKDGDFEKAELLSDTLANRQFAVKIAQAFGAKRCHKRLEEEKAAEKEKRLKKLRWTFEAKERWQMKGNM